MYKLYQGARFKSIFAKGMLEVGGSVIKLYIFMYGVAPSGEEKKEKSKKKLKSTD